MCRAPRRPAREGVRASPATSTRAGRPARLARGRLRRLARTVGALVRDRVRVVRLVADDPTDRVVAAAAERVAAGAGSVAADPARHRLDLGLRGAVRVGEDGAVRTVHGAIDLGVERELRVLLAL